MKINNHTHLFLIVCDYLRVFSICHCFCIAVVKIYVKRYGAKTLGLCGKVIRLYVHGIVASNPGTQRLVHERILTGISGGGGLGCKIRARGDGLGGRWTSVERD